MSRLIIFGITILMGASLFSYTGRAPGTSPLKQVLQKKQLQPAVVNDTTVVRNLVEGFGKKLQMVSLAAPKEIAARNMRENYGNYISAALLRKWQADPKQALGRMFSSPWPDRIEILNMEKTSVSVYKVNGEIIEITSVEKVNGGSAAKRPVTLLVKKMRIGAQMLWLIDEVIPGQYEVTRAVSYKNTQYGFGFSLPDSWKGYSIVTDKWEGLAVGDDHVLETGPIFLIRHPEWTKQNQRQDIPVMIFTLTQWDSLQQEKFHIGAAPIGPSELGRNNKYVFALPARYNYAFRTGFEEVEEILNGKPLQTFNI